MITFEVTIVCDGCKQAMVSGATTHSAVESVYSALLEGSRVGWMADTSWKPGQQWPTTYCPDCFKARKEKP